MLPQLPTTKHEDWKYTNLSRYYDAKEFENAGLHQSDYQNCDLSRPPFSADHTADLAYGNFRSDLLQLSSEKVEISELISAKQCSKTNFTDVAVQQHFQTGCHIKIAENTNAGTLALSNIQNSATQTVVDVAANSTATLVETFENKNQQVHNTQINLYAGAKLTYIRICSDSDTLLSSTTVNLSENANFNGFSLAQSGALNRHDMWINHTQQNSQASFNTLQLAANGAQLDTNLRCHHMQESCNSDILCKQIATGRSHTVFQGKFHVAQAAQQTDANMLCQNLPLTHEARCTSKPELEIYADDVQCSHGCTNGALDEAALFYLQARGISPEKARSMVLEGFVTSLIPAELCTSIATHITSLTQTWIEEHTS
jgi:Fe-S cluster assembly scaffold protein SufB